MLLIILLIVNKNQIWKGLIFKLCASLWRGTHMMKFWWDAWSTKMNFSCWRTIFVYLLNSRIANQYSFLSYYSYHTNWILCAPRMQEIGGRKLFWISFYVSPCYLLLVMINLITFSFITFSINKNHMISTCMIF